MSNYSVEIVAARYKEDVSWLEEHRSRGISVRVYNKGNALEGVPSVQLPNVGRESHSYLYHIVNNYNNLADWTVFTQAAPPRWGFFLDNDLTDYITFDDYLTSREEGSFMPFSQVRQLPLGVASFRWGFGFNEFRNKTKAICPADGSQGWSDWYLSAVGKRCRGSGMIDFYFNEVAQIQRAGHESVFLGFAQGARFAVSRGRIRRRPLRYYQALLAHVSRGVNPKEGGYMEAMWYDVFHPERLQAFAQVCAYPAIPEHWSAGRP